MHWLAVAVLDEDALLVAPREELTAELAEVLLKAEELEDSTEDEAFDEDEIAVTDDARELLAALVVLPED